ncbi:MAG: ATP-binding cassette domain-containing protein [Propionibacteriaceae bacterium]|nr:ATP-binding cassette domain-containing protein [Propionibacteriaceae bacterium]
MDSLVQLRGVRMSYGDGDVLQGIDLEIGRGEVIGLVGENGAGKSTLMHVLAGVLQPTAGSMVLRGEAYAPTDDAAGRAAGIGIVRQGFSAHNKSWTVLEALTEPGAEDPELTRKARQVLMKAGLALDLDSRLDTLSHAEHTMLESLRLLTDESLDLVILDEVMATMTAREIEDLHYVVEQMTAAGRSVIHVSHRLPEIIKATDRIVVLRSGRVKDLAKDGVTEERLLAEIFDQPAASPDPAGSAAAVREPAPSGPGRDASPSAPALAPAPAPQQARPTAPPRRPVSTLEAMHVEWIDAGPLRDVSFTLHRGEVLALVGRRDSGVHDIITALTGDRPQLARSMRVNGMDRHIASPRDAVVAGIGCLTEVGFDSGSDSDVMHARGLLAGGPIPDAFDAEVEHLATMLGALRDIDDTARLLFGRPMSGGQTQLQRLKLMLGGDAGIFILSEPTRGLDHQARQNVHGVVQAATRRGRAILLLNSDYDELLHWADRVLLVEGGAITDVFPASELTPQAVAEMVRNGMDFEPAREPAGSR